MAKPERDLREACIAEAMAIVSGEGVERLSLREVARRLGVSHQAPYKHFPSRDHILAAIVARAFAAFARFLDRHPRTGDADADLGGMGMAYLDYARANPLEYRLMFATPLPDGRDHPEMMAEARHAFALLCEGLRCRAAQHGAARDEQAIVLDALFIWSCLHGLAGIHASTLVGTLALPPGTIEASPAHVLGRVGDAMGR